MGDFEAYFWYVKSIRDLLPEGVAYRSEQYMNRQNGVILGFKNTSYMPEPTNWTSFTVANDTNETEDGNDTALDLNNPKGSVKVRSTYPVLNFI